MALSIGIVGLPNVGKSTLFNALTRAGAPAENYPFCTIDPNVGVVAVPDPRLGELAPVFRPRQVTPTAVTFHDIAGLARGAHRGEGLGNKFLHHIREVTAIAHVVRCFADPNVVHVEGQVDPIRDLETIELELALADLESLDRQYERTVKAARTGDRESEVPARVMARVREALDAGRPARSVPLDPAERQVLHHMHLLTAKPVMYVANLPDDLIATPDQSWEYQRLTTYVQRNSPGAVVVPVSARIEAELADLDDAEKAEFMAGLGLAEAGVDRVIAAGYRLLDLITFFTGNDNELRAWPVHRGTRAPQAAGEVHTDMERGFIRAEVVPAADLAAAGSVAAARERGILRLEGRDYGVQDGDVIYFRFNV